MSIFADCLSVAGMNLTPGQWGELDWKRHDCTGSLWFCLTLVQTPTCAIGLIQQMLQLHKMSPHFFFLAFKMSCTLWTASLVKSKTNSDYVIQALRSSDLWPSASFWTPGAPGCKLPTHHLRRFSPVVFLHAAVSLQEQSAVMTDGEIRGLI